MDVDALAQEIRRVDGSNSLGAGALAEALMPFLSTLVSTPPVEYEVEVTGYERNGRTGELRSVTIADDARKTSGRFVPEPPVSGEGELVERLRHLVSLNEPRNGGPYGGFAAEQCVAAMAEAASALTAANADRDRLARELEEAREANKLREMAFADILNFQPTGGSKSAFEQIATHARATILEAETAVRSISRAALASGEAP